MKIIPFVLLGLLILPESIIKVDIFPFSVANAHPVHIPVLDIRAYENDAKPNPALSAITPNPALDTVVGGRNPQRNPQRNSLECDACVFLANELNQTVIHNPKVVSFVTTDIEEICQVLPSSVQQLCMTAAEQAVPNLLNHIGDYIATEGCSNLGICHNKYS